MGVPLWPVSRFDLEASVFVPTGGLASALCRDAVKDGRRNGGAADAGVFRPRDGVEHPLPLAPVHSTSPAGCNCVFTHG